MLTIRLIGRPRLEEDGVAVPGPRGYKAWALLGLLARRREPISRRRLASDLFADADDPMGALRWTLAELRRRIAPASLGSDPVVLGLDGVNLDLHLAAAGHFELDALDGEFLEGVDVAGSPAFESWLMVERHRVDVELLQVLRRAALEAIAGRDVDRAVELATAMVRRAPYEEGSHILLVKALTEAGHQAAALRQVEIAERLFRDELGVAPSPAIRNAARPEISAPVPGVSPDVSAAALLEAGLSAVSAGAIDAGIECLRRAASDAEGSGDRDLSSRCLVELGTALVHSIRGFDDEGAVVLQHAVAIALDAGNPVTAAKAKAELAYLDVLAGRRASATDHLREAGVLAADDPGLLAAIAGFDAMNLHDWGRPAPAAERFAEAVDLARSAGNRRREIWALGIGARTLLTLGLRHEARAWASRACELADLERWASFRPWPETYGAQVRLAEGVAPAIVRAEVEVTFARARQLQDPCWEGVAAKTIGLTHIAENDYQAGLNWLENAAIWCGRVTDRYCWAVVDIQCAEAKAANQAGDHARARAVAERAVVGAARGQMDQLLEEATFELQAARAASP